MPIFIKIIFFFLLNRSVLHLVERDNKINHEALTRHGPPKAIDHHNEGVSYKISDDEKNMESDDDDDDDGMYNGIDFSQGIWSVDVEIIERKLDRTIDSGLISTIDVQNTLSESVNDTDTFPALTSHGPPKATDHNEGNSYKIYDDEKNMEKASNDEEGSIDGGFNGGWGMLVELDEGNSESTIENGLSSVTDVQNTSSGSSSDTNKVASKEEDEIEGPQK